MVLWFNWVTLGRNMMKTLKHRKPQRMKLVTGFCASAASLGVALLWESGGSIPLVSIGVAAGVGIGVIAVAGVVTTWFRIRRHRQLMNMRDSALW